MKFNEAKMEATLIKPLMMLEDMDHASNKFLDAFLDRFVTGLGIRERDEGDIALFLRIRLIYFISSIRDELKEGKKVLNGNPYATPDDSFVLDKETRDNLTDLLKKLVDVLSQFQE